uniref:BPTI/Kunitz inhibitor domain-containing protein n=1 Tax=Romanomermis culicivorax TaxID=13658 RepID=A0A915KDE6_ROMCU
MKFFVSKNAKPLLKISEMHMFVWNFLLLCQLMCEGCVVTDWAEWGNCVGTCILSLRLRNRDVQRPTVQIKDGRMVTLCQPLYQIQQCSLPDCPPPSAEAKPQQQQNVTAGVEKSDEAIPLISSQLNADSPPREGFFDPSEALLRIDEQFGQEADRDAGHVTMTTTQGYEELRDLLPSDPGGLAKINSLRSLQNDDKIAMKVNVPNEKSRKTSGTTNSFDDQSIFSPNDFVLPEPGNFYVFAGIREPRKPRLVIADQGRQGGHRKSINVSLLPPIRHDQILRDDQKVDFFDVKKINETVDSGSDPQNNTADRISDRLHVLNLLPPVDIESRNGSVLVNNSSSKSQDGKASCCRLEPKRCSNGRKPQIVTRWFREPSKNLCSSYVYNYCGLDAELQDQPMKFEQDCYDSCFTEDEKQTLPLFKDMKFENGFRVL